MHRRTLLKLSSVAAVASIFPTIIIKAAGNATGPFRFCLNMSTISGQKPGLLHSIEIAAAVGYDGVELWVSDIMEWLEQGNTIEALAKFIAAKKIRVENAISFTDWMVDDDAKRQAGLVTLENEMKMIS